MNATERAPNKIATEPTNSDPEEVNETAEKAWQPLSLGLPNQSHTMELTRRDALAALAAIGAVGGGGIAVERGVLRNNSETSGSFSEHETRTLNAVAAVLYPSAVTGIPEFVETYVAGRLQNQPNRTKGLTQSLSTLDDYARNWFGASYLELPRAKQDALLQQMGIGVAEPNPDGTPPERLRYHVVNELLYALYTTPTGGTLAGTENPIGHPGGTESYQRGPE